MKIDHDLRQAIKAACEVQPDRDFYNQSKSAAQEFLRKHPAIRKRICDLENTAEAKSKISKAAWDKVYQAKEEVGLERHYGMDEPRVAREGVEKFTKSGGKIEPRPKWKVSEVIAKLAAADPKDRDTILKEYGINWT